MTPGNLPLALYVGDTYSHALTFTDSPTADPEDLAHRRNLSGNTYLAQIRKSSGSTSVLAQFAVDTTDAATGVLVISLTADETELVPSGVCAWDLQETDGPTVSTVLAGQVTVTGDVSREGDLPPTVPSSGASGVVPVDVPIVFGTAGLSPSTFAITDVAMDPDNKFTVAGDQRALIGGTVVVTGSTGNNATYTVVSTAFLAGATVITVTEAVPDATVDGDLTTVAGVVLYDANDGDQLYDAWVDITEAWDGTPPEFDLGTFRGTLEGLFGKNGSGPLDMDNANDASQGEGMSAAYTNNRSLISDGGYNGNRLSPITFDGTQPLRGILTANGKADGEDPGSSQGAGIVHLLVIPAA